MLNLGTPTPRAVGLIILLLAVCDISLGQASSSDDLDFLHGLDEFENIRHMLPSYMEREAQVLVASRKQGLDVSTPEALMRRREFVRDHIVRAIGGVPERTPLNARTVETLDRQGYRIEKVIFESQPRFYVRGKSVSAS